MFEAISACVAWNAFFTTVFNPQLFWKLEIFLKFFFFIWVKIMKKLKLYKKNKSQKSKLSEIFDVVKNADRRACSLLTLLNDNLRCIFCYHITSHFTRFCWNILKLGLGKIVIVSYDSLANVNFSFTLIEKK